MFIEIQPARVRGRNKRGEGIRQKAAMNCRTTRRHMVDCKTWLSLFKRSEAWRKDSRPLFGPGQRLSSQRKRSVEFIQVFGFFFCTDPGTFKGIACQLVEVFAGDWKVCN